MAPEGNASPTPEPQSVVIASLENRRAAEHMLASLGRSFREKARKGDATAFVVSGNKDGSLKVTESRVLAAGDFSAAVIRIFLSIGIGFNGIYSTLKGAKGGVHQARKRGGHVGAHEQRAHEILATAGPHAAIAVIRCTDEEMRQTVATRARERSAGYAWDGSLTDFLSGLDPGPEHEWVRTALEVPSERS